MNNIKHINKKVSVIIPYYKGEKTIFNTINSVLKSYESSKQLIDVETYIFLDSIDDQSYIYERLTEEFGNKIKIIKNKENLGVARTRNNAIKYVSGDYLLFLDQDDCLEENYFFIISKHLNNNGVIVTNGYICNLKNKKKAPIFYVKPRLKVQSFLRANKIPTPGMVLIKKRLAEQAEIFSACSEEYKGADDWAAYINLFLIDRNLKFYYIKDKIFNYNLHGNNYSNNWEELNESAIATSKFFLNKFKRNYANILMKRIKILKFENMLKLNRRNKVFYLKNIFKILDYLFFHIVYINRIIGATHKKIIKFYI